MLRFRKICLTLLSLNSIQFAILALAVNGSTASAASNYEIVEPPASMGMETNNLGAYNPESLSIETCISLYQAGVRADIDGYRAINVKLGIVSEDPVLVDVLATSEFNPGNTLTYSGESADCSGRYEYITSMYTDILKIGDQVYETTFSESSMNPGKLVLKAAAQLHNGPVIRDDQYGYFQRYIDVTSLRIFAREQVSDSFLRNVATAYELMISPTEIAKYPARNKFHNTLSDYNIYQRIGYGGPNTNVMNTQPGPGDTIFSYDRYATDYIWEDHARSTKRQLGNVLEHLLHTITAVQFRLYWPEKWGFEDDSDLILAMKEAEELGYYNRDHPDDQEQTGKAIEFAYWVILAEWNLFEVAGKIWGGYETGNSEFTIGTSEEIKSKLPLAHKLYIETAATILSKPNPEKLVNLFFKIPYCSSNSEVNPPPADKPCPPER